MRRHNRIMMLPSQLPDWHRELLSQQSVSREQLWLGEEQPGGHKHTTQQQKRHTDRERESVRERACGR
jgi:hypothetical protein